MEINYGVLIAQAINFLIILFLFKYFVGDKISKAVEARRKELAKAQDASKIYEETLAKAEQDKKSLIDEALEHKNKVIQEASLAAENKASSIVGDAEKKAGTIIQQAEEKAQKLEKDLKDGFVQGVKQTANTIVKKLFDKDVKLQEEYVDALVKEYSA